jgi:hypothetical protein
MLRVHFQWFLRSFISESPAKELSHATVGWGGELRSPSTVPFADGRPTYKGVLTGSPRGSFTALLLLPLCHAAFSTVTTPVPCSLQHCYYSCAMQPSALLLPLCHAAFSTVTTPVPCSLQHCYYPCAMQPSARYLPPWLEYTRALLGSVYLSRCKSKRDGTRAENRFHLLAKRTSPF